MSQNHYILFLATIALFFVMFLFNDPINKTTTEMVASVFFRNSIDTEELVDQYEKASKSSYRRDKNVKVMIVAGHDNQNSGTQVGSITEAEINLIVAKKIEGVLSKEDGIETFLTRDENGYDSDLQEYFEENEDEIIEFRESKKEIMDQLVEEGRVDSYVNIQHNFAKSEVRTILYGINKYANENDFDIVIHIHFNDYPGRKGNWGKYGGFTLYIPEKQYSNAEASRDFAEKLKDQLLLSFAESDLPQESAITEDQELIAIGAYNTVDPIAVLIEYGYIYESQFTDPRIGDVILDELAYQTYLGVMNFLNDTDVVRDTFNVFSNHEWNQDLAKGDKGIDVLALQDYLRDLGHYPINRTLNECPLNGHFGSCTEAALIRYQEENSINPTGFFGEQTRGSVYARD